MRFSLLINGTRKHTLKYREELTMLISELVRYQRLCEFVDLVAHTDLVLQSRFAVVKVLDSHNVLQ